MAFFKKIQSASQPLWVIGGNGSNRLAYSTDAITWTASTSGNSIMDNQVFDIFTNGTRWVCGGDSTNKLAYSNDGITWSNSSNGNTIFDAAYSVCNNGSVWVAGGFGANKLAYSTDGITWTGSTSGNSVFSTVATIYRIAWNGSRFVAIGSDGSDTTTGYSTDGITWTAGSTLSGISSYDLAWDGSKFVIMGFRTSGPTSNAKLASSSDGITWSLYSSNIETLLQLGGYGIAWNGSIWVATGEGSFGPGGVSRRSLLYSSNAITWTNSSNGGTVMRGAAWSVAWNGTLWVAVSVSAPNLVAYSSDGNTWTAATSANSLFSQIYAVTSIPAPNLYPPIL